MEADLLQTLDSILYNIDTESWENTSFDLYSALGFISNENEYRIYDTFDKFSNEYMHLPILYKIAVAKAAIGLRIKYNMNKNK